MDVHETTISPRLIRLMDELAERSFTALDTFSKEIAGLGRSSAVFAIGE
jgi:hypothetical protein